MEKNDFSKEGEMPMNLNIEDKAPPTPKQPFFIGNKSYLGFFPFQISLIFSLFS